MRRRFLATSLWHVALIALIPLSACDGGDDLPAASALCGRITAALGLETSLRLMGKHPGGRPDRVETRYLVEYRRRRLRLEEPEPTAAEGAAVRLLDSLPIDDLPPERLERLEGACRLSQLWGM